MGKAAVQDREQVQVRLADVVRTIAGAMDLMDPAIAHHHQRVACLAAAVGRAIGLPDPTLRDLVLAACLHDCGAFSLDERLRLMTFEVARPHDHALAGFRLLRSCPRFAPAGSIVRHHHVPWESGRGERHGGVEVQLASHVLHLADRASVLLAPGATPQARTRAVRAEIRPRAGRVFVPELVEALCDLTASSELLESAVHPERSTPETDALGGELLSGGGLRCVQRLLWQLTDFRSPFTATHTAGVAEVAEHLAVLCGLAGGRSAAVGVAAGLHDVGKLAVPSEVLEKERDLTRGERSTLRGHPFHGYRLLAAVPGLESVNAWASFHHERLDGSGYPFHLAAARLPLESRIVAVADVFTALTEERPYRRGMSGREAVAIVGRMAGAGALDPGVAAIVARGADQLQSVRRLAQHRAGRRFAEFREQRSMPASHSAA